MTEKTINIAVDFGGEIECEPIHFVQDDVLTCKFAFTVADSFEEGETMFVRFVLPSGTLYNIEATIVTDDTATLILPADVLSEVGNVAMQIALYGTDGKRITSYTKMQMNVVRSSI